MVSSWSLPESIATMGTLDEATEVKLSGRGRSLLAGTRGGERRSPGGGVILTLGDAVEAVRRPLRTEWVVFPRLQEVAASDLEGAFSLAAWWGGESPRGRPPPSIVVCLGGEEL